MRLSSLFSEGELLRSAGHAACEEICASACGCKCVAREYQSAWRLCRRCLQGRQQALPGLPAGLLGKLYSVFLLGIQILLKGGLLVPNVACAAATFVLYIPLADLLLAIQKRDS